MPDRRKHRGPHPDDERLFSPEMLPRLRVATADLSWLLSRDYTSASALKLVGDRYDLEQRQRTAVARCACSDAAQALRQARQVSIDAIRDRTLLIDGYNLLTTVEVALAGGFVLAARDNAFRDMASMHGTWRRVTETVPAIELIGRFLAEAEIVNCHWYLDRPVSNSGRLKRILLDHSIAKNWHWEVELVDDPDRILETATMPVATADSAILDCCP
ncbi:MAG TPA: DUF434 domain-containing protein, partial [Planctomycetaceae bacterium]|nr:DUF434 domain-containing protein [Planctomycetaceae bacterium]